MMFNEVPLLFRVAVLSAQGVRESLSAHTMPEGAARLYHALKALNRSDWLDMAELQAIGAEHDVSDVEVLLSAYLLVQHGVLQARVQPEPCNVAA